MKIKKLSIFILIFFSCLSKAQQTPLNNQFLLNKFALSPAYAGLEETFVGFAAYRQDMIGVRGAPVGKFLNINGNVNDDIAVGVSIVNDQSDIFRNNQMNLSYTYHLNMTAEQSLSFALSGGIYENHINFSDEQAVFTPKDPIIEENKTMYGVAANAGFALLYEIYGLDVGVNIPMILENSLDIADKFPYQQKRMYQAHASYFWEVSDVFSFEPFFISRILPNTPLNWEASFLGTYKNMLMLACSYRNNQTIASTLGLRLNNKLALSYTYEFSGNGIVAESTGSHEVSLGFYFGDSGSGGRSRGNSVERLLDKNNKLVDKNNKLQKQHNDLLKENNVLRTKNNDSNNNSNNNSNNFDNTNNNSENISDVSEEDNINDFDTEAENYSEKAELLKGHYLVVESFRNPKNAERRKKDWVKQGYTEVVIYYEKSRRYYYIALKFENRNQAEEVRARLRNTDAPDAWIWDVE